MNFLYDVEFALRRYKQFLDNRLEENFIVLGGNNNMGRYKLQPIYGVSGIGDYCDFDGDIVFRGDTPRYELAIIYRLFNFPDTYQIFHYQYDLSKLKEELYRSV